METITRTLDSLRIGTARTFGGLTLYPLLGNDGEGGSKESASPYLTLDEALAAGTARLTEVNDAGSVPELRFVNDGDRPVLLLDGEEVTGAKQNRVLNLTILAPAGKSIVIPVSCVEQGRWRAVSDRFGIADQVMYSGGRMRKYAQVTSSMKNAGTRRSNQGAVWSHLSATSQRLGAQSATGKMDDVFQSRRREVDEYVAAFPAVQGQVGAVFALGGIARGVELFDRSETLEKLIGKLVRSWALEAVTVADRPHEVASEEGIRRFLLEVGSASASTHDGVGLGRDVRIAGEHLAGGALIHDDRVIHLCAFRMDEDGDGGDRKPRAGMASAYRRRDRFRGDSD